jgi:hypothetical protein
MTTTLIKKNASASDTVRLAQMVAWEHRNSSAVLTILQQFPFEPRLSWFRQVFWYIDKKLDYKFDDEGREQVKTPDRLFADGFGDCDDYSTLWMAILNNVGIESKPKIVDYEADGYWDHIYVIVPTQEGDYITLDNVAGKFRGTFNVEVERKDEKVFRSKYQSDNSSLSGLGAILKLPFIKAIVTKEGDNHYFRLGDSIKLTRKSITPKKGEWYYGLSDVGSAQWLRRNQFEFVDKNKNINL